MSVPKAGHGVVFARGDGGVGAGAIAYVTNGATNSQLKVQWFRAGTEGNGKAVTIVESGNNTPLSVVVTSSSVLINLETDGSGNSVSTVNDVIAALYADETFQTYWDANSGVGDGTGVLAAAAAANTASGTNGTEAFTAIAKVVGYTLPNRQRQVIEFTTHDEEAIQKLVSFMNNGELGLVLAYDSSDTGHAALDQDFEDGEFRNYQITLPDTGARKIQIEALVSNHQLMSESTDVLKASLSLTIQDFTDV